MHPDVLIIQDPTLLHQVNVFEGAGTRTMVLVNSSRGVDELGIAEFTGQLLPASALTVPASELAQRHLGRGVPNAALLGGFAALTGAVSLSSVTAAISERFDGAVAQANAAAAREALAAAEDQIAAVALAGEAHGERAAVDGPAGLAGGPGRLSRTVAAADRCA